MTLSIVIAIVAFIIGGYLFFQGKFVEHRIGISVLLILFIAGSFLWDNAAYLSGFCRHSGNYIESSGTMIRRGQHHGYDRAILSYSDGDEVKWASLPIAFYEKVPRKIPIMLRNGYGNYAAVTRTQITVTGRTLILAAMGVWILLACITKPSPKR